MTNSVIIPIEKLIEYERLHGKQWCSENLVIRPYVKDGRIRMSTRLNIVLEGLSEGDEVPMLDWMPRYETVTN